MANGMQFTLRDSTGNAVQIHVENSYSPDVLQDMERQAIKGYHDMIASMEWVSNDEVPTTE